MKWGSCLWSLSLLISVLPSNGADSVNPQCPSYWNGDMACNISETDFEIWNNLPMYECLNATAPPYTVLEAASTDRVRKNVEYLDEAEKIQLMKALACAQLLPDSLDMAEENNWPFVATIHGAPSWFKECRASGCCWHGNVKFVTWHRLLMLQFENSLRRWDLDLAVPYWNWANSSIGDFPDLVTRLSFTDPDTGVVYRNPWWNYRRPSNTINATGIYTCEYICRNPATNLFTMTNANNGDKGVTFYQQLLQSYEYTNWVAFDFLFEVPHNNIHDMSGGTLVDLFTVTYDPLFMLHHMAVERYFLIWQQLIEYQNISYRPGSGQISEYLGCFVDEFQMNHRLVPFNGTNTSYGDPITSRYAFNSFAPMNWEVMHYTYDPYPERYFGAFQNVSELASYVRTQRWSATKLYLGWYLIENPILYRVNYVVKRYGSNTGILNGSFAKLGTMPRNNTDGRYLYRVDITESMTAAGAPIDNLVRVEYTISSEGPDVVIPPPVIIYRNMGQETFRIPWGDPANFDVMPKEDIRIILGVESTRTTPQLPVVQLFRADETQGSLVTMHGQMSETLVVQEAKTATFVKALIGDVNVSVATFIFSTNASLAGVYVDNDQEYPANVLTSLGKNTFALEGTNKSLAVFVNHHALQGFDGVVFSPEASDHFFQPELGRIVVPFSEGLLEHGQALYGQIFDADNMQEVDFVSCERPLVGCLVNASAWVSCTIEFSKCFANFPIISTGLKYFIVNDKQLCKNGMKVAFDVQTAKTPSHDSKSACETLGIASGERWYTTIKNPTGVNFSIAITLQDDVCNATYKIAGPSNVGWFAVGLFGPFHTAGASGKKMQGFSIVASNTGGDEWAFGLYMLTDAGRHQISELLTCEQGMVDSSHISATCDSTLIPADTKAEFITHFLDFLPSSVPVLQNDGTYYYLQAMRNELDPAFSQIHEGEVILGQYQFHKESNEASSGMGAVVNKSFLVLYVVLIWGYLW